MNERLSFIDWMKVIGMGLIVWGHTGSDMLIRPTEPFNPKQLGVAFFVFVLGFSLAREKRPRKQVVFNRLFPIYLVGVGVAAILSAIDWVRVGDLRESNYLPLAFGINVLFDYFPANPTTWFIGTYTHIIVLWALLLSRFHFNHISLLVIFATEIIARACLIEYAGNFIAYMLLSNWITVLVLGMYFGQRDSLKYRSLSRSFLMLGATVVFLALWTVFTGGIGLSKDFPFNIINVSTNATSLLTTSTAISFLYAVITLLLFNGTQGLPSSRFVQFLARNTLFVFIVHMPLIGALAPVYYPLVPSRLLRIPINLILFFLLPAVVSEILFRLIDLKQLRDSTYKALQALFRSHRTHALQHD